MHKKQWKSAILLFIIVSVLISIRAFSLSDKIEVVPEWIASLGAWGPIVYVLIYICGVVAALPGSALTIAAGPLFGSFFGVILVSISSTIGAGLCFIISRYIARESVSNRLYRNEKFKRLDDLTEKHGATIVAITRLVPLFPFNLLNYGFGLTKVPFITYIFWSWLCMLPGTILYVVGADALWKVLIGKSIPIPLILIVLSMIIVLTIVVKIAKKKL
ncbi:MAG: TVP38/TMEM64 family protein [Nitrospirae bacterium]|nr:MAG: TVP38/TMEM64 family protein [Nitrospirota bacterium]